MSIRFRQYNNGVYGYKYKNYYVIPVDNDKYQVIDDKFYLIFDNLDTREDAVWEIEKKTSNEKEKELLKFLYDKSIPDLTSLMMEYYGKKEKESKYIYTMTMIIRNRKDEGKDW